MSSEDKSPMNKAVDLSHHLSEVSKARKLSPLKGLQKYFARPGMISLAGGMPDPAYFPFASISGDALLPDSFPSAKPSESSLFSWFWSWFTPPAEKSERFTVPKYGAKVGDVDLANALQYAPATGIPALQEFIRDFTGRVYRPGYSDWTTMIHHGNTDGIQKAIGTLCNPGERVLVEQWCYPSFLANVTPMRVLPVSVKMDAQGLSAVDLEHLLSTWDETAMGAKRPHVMYVVPIGQNPTGATMGVERKKAIYELCVKYDIIIIEDDPYFFLQEGIYYPKELRPKSKTPRPKKGEDDVTQFINSLVPSFVRFDYQGRVIRLDTFSKIIAPGSRMGWFTCNPMFAERLERQAETSTQSPSGFSQSLLAQLLTSHWSFPEFIRWLQGLQTQYTLRRDFFVDCIFEEFEVRPAESGLRETFGAGLPVFTAYSKTRGKGDDTSVMREKHSTSKVPLFSFVPPSSGMFVWLKFHIHDRLSRDPNVPEGKTPEERVWLDLAEHGLLIVPGSSFSAISHNGGWLSNDDLVRADPNEITFRLSFSKDSHDLQRAGVKILADVLRTYST